ncbi:hypothetical protein ACEQ8H_004461 [Pleosporales sp. CAS-2024a]
MTKTFDHFVKQYYAQRASNPGTLLSTEATTPSQLAGSITHMPEIWSDAHIAARKDVVDTGSYMFLQIASNGRVAFLSERTKDGFDLFAPSAIAIGEDPSGSGVIPPGEVSLVPREMTDKETTSNQRTDSWGGHIKNRSRFVIEIAKAVIAAVEKEKVGFRFSRWSTFLSMRMANPVPQYTYLIEELRALGISFIGLVEPRITGDGDGPTDQADSLIPLLDAWGRDGPAILAGVYSSERWLLHSAGTT